MKTSKFATFTSKTFRLPQKDIDTDAIIPADALKTTEKSGLGDAIFKNLRDADPNFPKINGERILVAGRNFGCGSSREHAVWALKSAGIDVVISSKFADIFRGNAGKNNLLTIQLPEKIVQGFCHSGEDLTIDLENNRVIDAHDHEYFFEISEFLKKKMLRGESDLDFLLEFREEVRKFEKKRKLPTA